MLAMIICAVGECNFAALLIPNIHTFLDIAYAVGISMRFGLRDKNSSLGLYITEKTLIVLAVSKHSMYLRVNVEGNAAAMLNDRESLRHAIPFCH